MKKKLIAICIMLALFAICVFFWLKSMRVDNIGAVMLWAFAIAIIGGIGAGVCYSHITTRIRKIKKQHIHYGEM